MAPPSLRNDVDGGNVHHAPTTAADRELLAATKQLPRLGATPLPPRTTTPVVGELLLFVPSLSIKSQAAPRPPPTRLQVRAAWWGEEEDGNGTRAAGTVLLPRVLEGAPKLRALGGRPLEPRTRENACVFPVRVEEGALWSYLGDMVSQSSMLVGGGGLVLRCPQCCVSVSADTSHTRRLKPHPKHKIGPPPFPRRGR